MTVYVKLMQQYVLGKTALADVASSVTNVVNPCIKVHVLHVIDGYRSIAPPCGADHLTVCAVN